MILRREDLKSFTQHKIGRGSLRVKTTPPTTMGQGSVEGRIKVSATH